MAHPTMGCPHRRERKIKGNSAATPGKRVVAAASVEDELSLIATTWLAATSRSLDWPEPDSEASSGGAGSGVRGQSNRGILSPHSDVGRNGWYRRRKRNVHGCS